MLTPLEKEVMENVSAKYLMTSMLEIAMYQRYSGSPQEIEALRFIEGQMTEYGYRTSLIFHDAYISTPLSATLRIQQKQIRCITHSFGISTPDTGVSAELICAGRGAAADYQGMDARGKIVLIDGMASPAAAQIASSNGAIGQIHMGPDDNIHEMIVSNVWGNPDDHSRSTLPRTHVISIGRSDGLKLRQMLSDGPLTVTMQATVDTAWTHIPLLIGDLDGTDGTGDHLLMSGHIDSWYYGAMDNGSANATMMEVARLLAARKEHLRRGLKVCFWSGHSHGRYAGSAWFADTFWEDIDKHCIMHLNVDSTGGIGAMSDANVMAETKGLAAWAVGAVTDQQLTGKRISRMGDQSFWGIGVPSLFVGLSEQPPSPDGTEQPGLGWWWHTPADLPDKIDPRFLVRDTQVYALVATRLLTAPVLPFDYTAHVDSWLACLERIKQNSGGLLDLSAVEQRATELRKKLVELVTCTGGAVPGAAVTGTLAAGAGFTSADPDSLAAGAGFTSADSDSLAAGAGLSTVDPSVLNRCLKKLGRALIPVNFTQTGRFGHDPALNVPELPDLQEATRLPGLTKDEARFLMVRLTRARNKAMASLAEACAAVEEALAACSR